MLVPFNHGTIYTVDISREAIVRYYRPMQSPREFLSDKRTMLFILNSIITLVL